MNSITQKLSDSDIDALATYIDALRPRLAEAETEANSVATGEVIAK